MSNARLAGQALQRMTNNRLGSPQGPVRGRVVKQYRAAKGYTVDVQVLNVFGEPDERWPVVAKIEVPVLFWLGDGTGCYAELAVGALVRVGFYEFDRHRPYLDAVLGGVNTPECDNLSLVIFGTNATVRITNGVVSISAGSVSLSGGHIGIGSGEDEFGNGGDIVAQSDNDTTVTAGANAVITATANATVNGAQVLLGAGAAQPAVLGTTLINLLTALTVGGVPIDNAAALKTALQTQALSSIVKVK